jgi:hypothetical protein
MTQALYAHMNNKKIKIRKKKRGAILTAAALGALLGAQRVQFFVTICLNCLAQ